MHYYQLNIGDYAKSTAHLSDMEDLAYRRLLDLYYDTEKPLEENIDKLCRLVRLVSHKKETQQVLEEFFSLTQKGWIQKRVQKELAAYSAKAAVSRANGKKGGRPRITQQVNLDNPDLTQKKAKQETLNIKHKPITNIITSVSDKPKRKLKTGLPDDFLLIHPRSALASDYWIKKGRSDLLADVEDIFDQFRNHHTQNGSKMACWESAWKTWYANAVKFNKQQGSKNEKPDYTDTTWNNPENYRGLGDHPGQ